MLIKFTKMQSLGHDLMVVNLVTQKAFFNSDLMRRLSHRRFGVGFEHLLLVEPPYDPDVDFYYRVYSTDGQELAMQSQAAACCCLRFALDHRLCIKTRIVVCSLAGQQTICLDEDDKIAVTWPDGSTKSTSCERIYEGTLML